MGLGKILFLLKVVGREVVVRELHGMLVDDVRKDVRVVGDDGVKGVIDKVIDRGVVV
ncbi:hypothetical protein [Cytobacillus oceanisediminis]|uniref:hypothetical protein n=1 Tax=Cytobacillus oceanisediminis TaxID=665099 RepID=UPI0016430D62|nr:hypothetical protein [Cytobacillus oceanisediminis]